MSDRRLHAQRLDVVDFLRIEAAVEFAFVAFRCARAGEESALAGDAHALRARLRQVEAAARAAIETLDEVLVAEGGEEARPP